LKDLVNNLEGRVAHSEKARAETLKKFEEAMLFNQENLEFNEHLIKTRERLELKV